MMPITRPDVRRGWLVMLALLIGVTAAATPRVAAAGEDDAAPGKDVDVKKDDSPWYTYGKPSFDGIGKFYMGREIAQVMGHLAAGWLERPEREREEKPAK